MVSQIEIWLLMYQICPLVLQAIGYPAFQIRCLGQDDESPKINENNVYMCIKVQSHAVHMLCDTVAEVFGQVAPPCANNHCSTQYEQSFRHNKHTHTNQKAATDKHTRHNH